MGGTAPERGQNEQPDIPAFFSLDDLPSWLREDAPAAVHPARVTRARAAWAVTAASEAPHETPFRTAADATWSLLTSPQRPTRQGRRGSATH